ncbi:STAS domain-containing protein [Maridesulfovibrio salexigens]|uniref:Anti-sigma factor antagonist n=1 Tax=Maridesulfovibrio salexigens (strain ATCC 14822 / DSM 2638 / NCIMB 8403 / VKM B-1763) TaxID=526222 RepID=C6BXD6_MARSD|nr:STAS domain-containing protein [Maridesulfovibrio salexigens]ACS80442.1 anti-sigma-factor antagonist [Maridesulfovibrio salexigens DSM 2638]
MILSHERVGDFVILRVGESRVDATNSSELQEHVSSLVSKGGRSFVLDLSAVLFMDSCGLAGLIPITNCMPKDGRLLIAGLHPKVEQIFKLTKLNTIFNIYPSVGEALKS